MSQQEYTTLPTYHSVTKESACALYEGYLANKHKMTSMWDPRNHWDYRLSSLRKLCKDEIKANIQEKRRREYINSLPEELNR